MIEISKAQFETVIFFSAIDFNVSRFWEQVT